MLPVPLVSSVVVDETISEATCMLSGASIDVASMSAMASRQSVILYDLLSEIAFAIAL